MLVFKWIFRMEDIFVKSVTYPFLFTHKVFIITTVAVITCALIFLYSIDYMVYLETNKDLNGWQGSHEQNLTGIWFFSGQESTCWVSVFVSNAVIKHKEVGINLRWKLQCHSDTTWIQVKGWAYYSTLIVYRNESWIKSLPSQPVHKTQKNVWTHVSSSISHTMWLRNPSSFLWYHAKKAKAKASHSLHFVGIHLHFLNPRGANLRQHVLFWIIS
jgi:hypothetical protein